jgi:hypothetical protein
MNKEWNPEQILQLMRDYQRSCILAAGAELDIFTQLATKPMSAKELSKKLKANLRGLLILLDVLSALELLDKQESLYSVPTSVANLLTSESKQSVLPMILHQGNCLRRWAQIGQVVKTGKAAKCLPSIRGKKADYAAFIGAMTTVSAPVADGVIQAVIAEPFNHLLDVAGAAGTWTLAFLRNCPRACATLFDLPHVIPMAKNHITQAGFASRIKLVPGNYMSDALPKGADLAWVSAVVHQNSRKENRLLFKKVFKALVSGGRIAIRDIVMDETKTRPISGALFAVNMLVGTKKGGTFTFQELKEDLNYVGFTNTILAKQDEGMHSIIIARKP